MAGESLSLTLSRCLGSKARTDSLNRLPLRITLPHKDLLQPGVMGFEHQSLIATQGSLSGSLDPTHKHSCTSKWEELSPLTPTHANLGSRKSNKGGYTRCFFLPSHSTCVLQHDIQKEARKQGFSPALLTTEEAQI